MNLRCKQQFNNYEQNFTAQGHAGNISVGKLKELLAQGFTTTQIAELTGMKVRTIYSRIKNFGLETPTQTKNKRMDALISSAMLENENVAYIIKETGAASSRVEKWLKEHLGKTSSQKKRETFINLLKSDLTDSEIAERMQVSIFGVQAARKRYKINRNEIKKQYQMERIQNAMAEGLNYSEIAQKLDVSISTVKLYAREIKRKLNFQA